MMNYLKMLGLTAVAVTALLAVFGGGTASATVLCETNVTTGCGTAWAVKSGTTLKLVAEGSTTLTGPFGELVDTCTGSTMEGPITSTGSSTTAVTVNVATMDVTGCTKATTVIETSPKGFGTLEFANVAGTKNGTVLSTGFTYIMHNTLFGTCQFLTSHTGIGTLTGKDNTATGKPTLDIGADSTGRMPSENCGFSGLWEGSYEYSGTTPFNIAAS